MQVAAQKLGRPYQIKVSRIKRFEGQPRRFFDESGIKTLADSIQQDGQQQPIKVCNAPEPGTFMLIDGERRWRAFQIIHQRTGKEPLIDAFIEVIRDPKEHFRRSVIANLHREDLSPLDEAASLYQLRQDGETVHSLATLIGKSANYVEGYLRMHTLPETVKRLMSPELPKEERLSVTSAVDIARSTPDPKLRLEIAQEAIIRQLSVMDTRSLITHRTGAAGYRIGGFQRKPDADYKFWTAFLGRLIKNSYELSQKLDIASLYHDCRDERACRRNDAKTLRQALGNLEAMLREIER